MGGCSLYSFGNNQTQQNVNKLFRNFIPSTLVFLNNILLRLCKIIPLAFIDCTIFSVGKDPNVVCKQSRVSSQV